MSPTLLHSQRVQRYLQSTLVCSVPTSEKCVALTFDDGPSSKNTPALLDLLERRGVRATFFLVGRRVRQFPELTREIRERGHEIGNHGYRHVPISLLPRSLVEKEIRDTEQAILDAAGVQPTMFRPPMGWFSHRTLRIVTDQGYQPVLGSIHPEDSRQPPVEKIVDRVLSRVEPGSIIILHDGGWRTGVDRSRTIEAVSRILDGLEGTGYRTMTVGEMLGPGTPGMTSG